VLVMACLPKIMPAENYSIGMPVEVGKIDRELKKLWEEAGGAMTRASLVNLAIYSEEPGSLERNTRIISQITEDHSCRAIVVSVDRVAKKNQVEAWISAHCHTTRTGSKQVCSEQISFSLQGPCVKLLPSIVFSHLDSDLPFYLWWQGSFHDPMDPQLWTWVDRLIYDSQIWDDFRAQLHLVETAQSEAKERVVLCDLNWVRLFNLRLALAQFFDHPGSHHHLTELTGMEVDFASDHRSTAILLVGWIGAQLQWKLDAQDGSDRLKFRNRSNEPVEVTLNEKTGERINRCVLSTRNLEFRVAHETSANLLRVSLGRPGEDRMHQLMPAGKNDTVELVSAELMRGGPHRVYLRALNCVRELL
jgi:glucose-6-phosphate dehydrogenase assembly protein OpcA